MNYTFIKVTCRPESRTAILEGLYVFNEAGAKKAKTRETDTYYLDNITKNRFQGKSEEINICNFGSGQTASFVAQQSHEHPRANGLMLFLNGKEIHGWYTLAYGGWTLEIRSLGEGQFDLHHCRDEHLPTQPKCGDAHVLDGKVVRTHKNNVQ